MQKVHVKDKNVVFIVDLVEDISFAEQLTTRVYLPGESVSSIEWDTEVYEKHFVKIVAGQISDVPGWYRLQTEIIEPIAQARAFNSINILVYPRG